MRGRTDDVIVQQSGRGVVPVADHHFPQKHGTRPGKSRTPSPSIPARGSPGQGERSLTRQFEIPYGLHNPLGLVSVSTGYLCPLGLYKPDKAIGPRPLLTTTHRRFFHGIVASLAAFTTQRVLLPQCSSSPTLHARSERPDRECKPRTQFAGADSGSRHASKIRLSPHTHSCRLSFKVASSCVQGRSAMVRVSAPGTEEIRTR